MVQKATKDHFNSLNDNFFELLRDKNKRINMVSKNPNSMKEDISILNRLRSPDDANVKIPEYLEKFKGDTCNICNKQVNNNEAYVILKCCKTTCHYNCLLYRIRLRDVLCHCCKSKLEGAFIKSWYEISDIVRFIKNYKIKRRLCCFKPLEDKDIMKPFSKDDSCTICLDEFRDESEYIILKCRHRYHYNCLLSWVMADKYTCPLCKQELSEAQIAPYTIKPLYETEDIVSLCQSINNN